jgi:ATP-dependent Clp protease protease subunit
MNYVPIVLESTGRGDRSWDLYSRLLLERIVFLGSVVTDDVANIIVAQLLFLESQDTKREISIYINSPGGSVVAGLAILDTMNYLHSPIQTICYGQAASMAAVLLSAGAKGKRFALPNSRVMIHQVSGGAGGQATDVEIQAREMLKLKRTLNEILAKNSGQSVEKVTADCERDYFMSSEEAKAYGLIDSIMDKRPTQSVSASPYNKEQ